MTSCQDTEGSFPATPRVARTRLLRLLLLMLASGCLSSCDIVPEQFAAQLLMARGATLADRNDDPARYQEMRPLGQPPHSDGIPAELARLVADARSIAKRTGAPLWPGFGDVEFSFLLVENDRELLACDGRIPAGFTYAGHDGIIGCDFAVGPKSWRSPALLASMPAFGPPSTIVMGTPEATGKTVAQWQLTILHEHFHQWQSARQEYYQQVAGLGLANGDESGMWMLNYPFPYDEPAAGKAHAAASKLLAGALQASGREADARVARYLEARKRFQATVSAADWRYFEFQLWQEGVARWTEIMIGERSGIGALEAEAARRHHQVIHELQLPDLARDRRLAAYAMGAGEAMLLERTRPRWRMCYPDVKGLGVLLKDNCRKIF